MGNQISTHDGFSEDEKNQLKLLDSQISILQSRDSYSNIAARLGLGSDSLNEGAFYYLTRLTFDYQQLTAMYRNSWIIREGINIIANDMHKLGIDIKSELQPEQIEKVQKKLNDVRQKQIECTRWGRLYGGAVALMLIGDSLNKFVTTPEGSVRIIELPLEITDIDVDSFHGLYVLDRWNGVSPTGEIEKDPSSYQFGLPKYYTLTFPDKSSIKVHHSWLLIDTGLQLPRLERYADAWWGMSALEPVYRELQKHDNTNYSIANLIFQSSIRVFKFDGFKQATASTNKKFQEEMNSRLETLTKLQHNHSATVIDTKDDFQVHNQTFAGLDAVLNIFKGYVAAAFRIPQSKFYGLEASGLGSDDVSSLRNYSDDILSGQEEKERHNYEKLLNVICKSELGMVPKDIDFEFVTHYRSDIETRRSQFEQEMTMASTAFENGGIKRSTYLKELKEIGSKYNVFTNITDAEIAEAEKEENFDEGDLPPNNPEVEYESGEGTTDSKKKFVLFRKKKK